MYSTKIKALHDEYSDLIGFCREHNQISYEMYINDICKKALLLSAASYFEAQISNAIHDFASTASKDNNRLVSFIDNKALKRQYHTFFDWDASNANKFLALFGDDFKKKVREKIKENKLDAAERDFIAIGKERNCLVHQNYVEVSVNSTFEDIFNRYTSACNFVELFIEMLAAEK